MIAPADPRSQLDAGQMPAGSVEVVENTRDADWWGNFEDRTVMVVKHPFKLVFVPLEMPTRTPDSAPSD